MIKLRSNVKVAFSLGIVQKPRDRFFQTNRPLIGNEIIFRHLHVDYYLLLTFTTFITLWLSLGANDKPTWRCQ